LVVWVLSTDVFLLFSLLFDFLGEFVLNVFNLFVDVGDLLLNVGGLSGDDGFSDLLSLDLLVDESDSLLSLLGDS
jgi:hypothetical protein